MILFYEDKCQGCGLCVAVCPKKILTIDRSRINKRGHAPVVITDEGSCISCALCAMMCPDCVIEVSKEAK
ncbi:MAG TPA: 4Fe-4S binding protein [Mobilitalea sp.]|nr:4Fe-4S binding protein [Mobilitalea sp.]